jgi:seryl-tRNA synthetase
VNGTALAVPRIILSLLENHYDEQKNVLELPSVLKPYAPFLEGKIPS